MSADELSAIGAKCRRRATLEGERRWCDNKSEQLNDSQVKLTKREMLATLLDLELLYFFTSGRSDRSLPLLAPPPALAPPPPPPAPLPPLRGLAQPPPT